MAIFCMNCGIKNDNSTKKCKNCGMAFGGKIGFAAHNITYKTFNNEGAATTYQIPIKLSSTYNDEVIDLDNENYDPEFHGSSLGHIEPITQEEIDRLNIVNARKSINLADMMREATKDKGKDKKLKPKSRKQKK